MTGVRTGFFGYTVEIAHNAIIDYFAPITHLYNWIRNSIHLETSIRELHKAELKLEESVAKNTLALEKIRIENEKIASLIGVWEKRIEQLERHQELSKITIGEDQVFSHHRTINPYYGRWFDAPNDLRIAATQQSVKQSIFDDSLRHGLGGSAKTEHALDLIVSIGKKYSEISALDKSTVYPPHSLMWTLDDVEEFEQQRIKTFKWSEEMYLQSLNVLINHPGAGWPFFAVNFVQEIIRRKLLLPPPKR